MVNASLGSFYRKQLLARGPATVEELHAAAVLAGVTTSRTDSGVRSVLARDPCCIRRPDGRFDCAKRLLQGSVFTTPVRYPTADRQEVWAGPELAPMDLLFVDGPVPLVGGDVVSRSKAWQGTWIGPPGWLPKARARELLAFRWTGSALDVTTLAALPEAATGPQLSQVQRVLARHRQPGGYVCARVLEREAEELARTVLRALVEVPDLFAAELPPLDELITAEHPAVPERVAEPAGAPWLAPQPGEPNGQTSLHLELPTALAVELQRRAPRGMSLGEYAQQVLAVEGWRTQSRHD